MTSFLNRESVDERYNWTAEEELAIALELVRRAKDRIASGDTGRGLDGSPSGLGLEAVVSGLIITCNDSFFEGIGYTPGEVAEYVEDNLSHKLSAQLGLVDEVDDLAELLRSLGLQ